MSTKTEETIPVYAILSDPSFWALLLRLDEDLAAEARAAGCPHCGAPLHSGHYPRKPRGIARSVLGAAYEHRLSFCCSREGCRRRVTPPSVRFFGRRVFLGALVVLVSALSRGLTGKRRAWLAEQIGAGADTLERWRRWWRVVFPTTRCWQARRGQWLPPPAPEDLPVGLLARFGALEDARTLLSALLITTLF
jgi:hypothetical protein